MLEKLKQYNTSIWRVPLIAIIAGFFYTPLYVRIVLRFGVHEPGVIDDGVALMTSAGIFLAVGHSEDDICNDLYKWSR